MNREPITVTLGLNGTGGDTPITCIPADGSKPVYCYATREQEAQFGIRDTMAWWAEFNGISYDLIEPMTDAEILATKEARLLTEADGCPF